MATAAYFWISLVNKIWLLSVYIINNHACVFESGQRSKAEGHPRDRGNNFSSRWTNLLYSYSIFLLVCFFPTLLQMVQANSGSWSVVQKASILNIYSLLYFFSFLICSSVLEYDAEGFMKLSLLFKVQGFFCIVHSKCSFWYKFEVKKKQHILHFDTRKWDILNRNQSDTYNGHWPKGAFWLRDVLNEWGLTIITTRFICLFSWIRQELSPRSAIILPPVDLPRKK